MKFFAIVLLAVSSAYAQCKCGTVSYSTSDITNGINKGFSINPNPTSSSGAYPHRFGNREKLPFAAACSGKTLVEYPLKQGSAYNGGPPGADRVVYLSGGKTLCGCMTHTGASTPAGFVKCT